MNVREHYPPRWLRGRAWPNLQSTRPVRSMGADGCNYATLQALHGPRVATYATLDPAEAAEAERAMLVELMGEPIEDRSEHAGRGDTVERRRVAYGERVTSTTTAGVGPTGTFGSFLGVTVVDGRTTTTDARTVFVVDSDGDVTTSPRTTVTTSERTDLAVSPDTGRLAGTRQHTSRANGRKRVATCECGTCQKCRTRARVQRHRARITEEQRRAERELALK
jgi:hypothetical protein